MKEKAELTHTSDGRNAKLQRSIMPPLLIVVVMHALITCGSAASLAPRMTTTSGSVFYGRRAVLGRALTASSCAQVSLAALPAHASKFPQHVEDLDRAAASGDVGAVQRALQVLALPSDEAAALRAIKPIGDSAALSPKVNAVSEKVSSFKVSVSAPRNENVLYMWLARTDTGGLVGVQQIAPAPGGGTASATFACSVPKLLLPSEGLSLVPCVYSPASGIWRGEPAVLQSAR